MVPKSHKQHTRTHAHISLRYSASFCATFSLAATRYSSHSSADVRVAFRENLRKSVFPDIHFLILHAGKITKVCFEIYNKKITTGASTKDNTI